MNILNNTTGVSSIKTPEIDQKLMNASRGFERLLLMQVFKSMQDTIPKDPSVKNDFSNSVHSRMFADAVSKNSNQNFGIAEQIYQQMLKR